MPQRVRECKCDCPDGSSRWDPNEDPDEAERSAETLRGTRVVGSELSPEPNKPSSHLGGAMRMRLGVVTADGLGFPPRNWSTSPTADGPGPARGISAVAAEMQSESPALTASAAGFATALPNCAGDARSARSSDEVKAPPLAETKCDKLTGTLERPSYGHAVKAKTFSPCVHNLIIAHEHGHYFDPLLRAACQKFKQDGDATAWNEQVRQSECREYKLDKQCLVALKDCCGKRDSSAAADKKKAKCCACEDVDKAIAIADANLKANKCR